MIRSLFRLTSVLVVVSFVGCNDGGGPMPAVNTGKPVAKSGSDTNVPADAGKVASGPTEASSNGNATASTDAGPPSASVHGKTSRKATANTDAGAVSAEDKTLAGINDPRVTRAFEQLKTQLVEKPQDATLRLSMVGFLQQVAGMQIQSGQQEKGMQLFQDSAKWARELMTDGAVLPDGADTLLGQVFYNEACALASGGHPDQALDSLDVAVKQGFSDIDQMKSDEDLTSVRAMPAFAERLAGWEAAAKEASQKHVAEELAQSKSFPFDFEVTDVNGKPHTLADYKGKVVIVDIWGTWCPPCRAELPSFIKLQKTHGPQGFQMIGLNYEDDSSEETAKKVREFITANGINYPCALGDESTRAQVPDFQGYPTTLFIDATGKVRLKAVGLHDYAYLEGIVTTLLAETKSGDKPADATPADSP